MAIAIRTTVARAHSGSTYKKVIPLLENGDHLSQKEFHRRYLAMPDAKAQLVEGIVYMSSPASQDHGRPLSLVSDWLGRFEAFTPGVKKQVGTSVILDNRNEVQPDIALVTPPKGSEKEKYIQYAPVLVVEISNSTVSIDLNQKFEAYRRNKVREYIVHRVQDMAVDWFTLVGEKYEKLLADRSGIIRSAQFPGLWLNVNALVKDDLLALLKTVELGTKSPAHVAYCERFMASSDSSTKKRTR